MKKIVYHYVLNTMSDWETGYLTSELISGRYFKKNTEKFELKSFALTKEPITTMGGMRILPDVSVDEVDFNSAALMILPGAETWLDKKHDSVLNKAGDFLNNKIPVAAICGATFGLALHGFLDEREHTSNDLGYLKAVCPNYSGGDLYKYLPAVAYNNLITASGIAPLEFAYETIKHLNVFSDTTLEAWFNLNKYKEAKYFFELMGSLNQD